MVGLFHWFGSDGTRNVEDGCNLPRNLSECQ